MIITKVGTKIGAPLWHSGGTGHGYLVTTEYLSYCDGAIVAAQTHKGGTGRLARRGLGGTTAIGPVIKAGCVAVP